MGDILFLAHRLPFPPDRGDKIRAFHILKHLAARRRVHLATFADDARDLHHREAFGELTGTRTIVWRSKPDAIAAAEALVTGKPVSVTAFSHPRMREAVARILAENAIETIHVFSSQMAQYVPADFAGRVVMDFCDVDAAKFAEYGRTSGGLRGWMMRREGRLLLSHDRAVAMRADANLFVSEAEAALFARLTGVTDVRTIENGIDAARFDPAAAFAPVATAGPLIVFTGQMDYPPNIEAVAWFATAILPAIRRRHPTARFAIVGRAPTPAVLALAGEGVVVTGAVDDVRGWLAAATVCVAPLRHARGIQNKVLEAMAMARAVVASPAAAEGIDHGGTLEVADGAAAFAATVSNLIDDIVAAEALGRAARARVVARYGWEARLAPLDTLMGLDA